MLNKEELAGYGTDTLTGVFLERVFQECLTYEGEMDYKTYLDFVLALENRHEPQAIQEQMTMHGQEPVNFEDVKDIVGTLLINQVTRTRAHACVAIGCARPLIACCKRPGIRITAPSGPRAVRSEGTVGCIFGSSRPAGRAYSAIFKR
ncbi:Serine/threonine-protein phosphatase 2A regulatory subunit B'' subunit gamma [Trachymyrmex cornetzi]|uniref:Serine/threonine-protein phosphatase 2A regulatory subunit B'' subunit gamma n=1 Tax=Trachymyrmex cornetzi TaxID=471704 RepID=A0A151IV93_9HYME|nr:Serine/threonine-protein phosphatase 2A regulatory subunit B'' subunit gamma [Trachymyrmex cornetzi]